MDIEHQLSKFDFDHSGARVCGAVVGTGEDRDVEWAAEAKSGPCDEVRHGQLGEDWTVLSRPGKVGNQNGCVDFSKNICQS